MISHGRDPSIHLFRVSSHANIWCVLRNGAFFADYDTQAEAIDAAHAAARREEAFGHRVQVLTPSSVSQARAESDGDE